MQNPGGVLPFELALGRFEKSGAIAAEVTFQKLSFGFGNGFRIFGIAMVSVSVPVQVNSESRVGALDGVVGMENLGEFPKDIHRADIVCAMRLEDFLDGAPLEISKEKFRDRVRSVFAAEKDGKFAFRHRACFPQATGRALRIRGQGLP